MKSKISLMALAVATVATPALAQQASDTSSSDIVVTAQRRSEKSVDVPITITQISDKQLATANIQQITQIDRVTPGLRFDFSSGYVQPNIRGVGSAVVSSGSSGNVGIYVDGFYTPNPLGSAFELMNVRNIQVLKGPQGTLFGRNTTGGAVIVQTAEPSTHTSGQFKVSYGRYNEVRAQGYATFGLTENVAVDAEGLYTRGDGWQTNISNGKRVGDYHNWSARFGIKADLSDAVSVLLRYQHNETDDPRSELVSGYKDPVFGSGAPFFATPAEITYDPNQVATGTNPNDQEFLRTKSDIVQATIKVDLGFANLTSYTQYRKENTDAALEGDYYGTVLYELGLPNDNKSFSQELLLTSKPGGKLQYTAGLFYFQNTDTYRVYFDYFPAFGLTSRSDVSRFGSSTTPRSYAAFADLTYELAPKLFVTAGGRYAHDQIDDVYYIAPFTYPTKVIIQNTNPAAYKAARQNHFTPRIVLRYKPTDQTSVYASFTKGYKAALLDVGGGSGNYVKPEQITSYEVGAKYDSSNLSVEASAFYYDYKDLQVSLYRFGQAEILNAAKSKIYGIDAQFRWDVTDAFQVTAGGAWVHARYKQFDNAPFYVPCLTIPATDPNSACLAGGISFPVVGKTIFNTTMQRTPEFTGNIGVRYGTVVAGGKTVLSSNLYYSSKLYFGPSGVQFPQGAFASLALRAAWTDPSDRYTIAVWGDNVTNNRHRVGVQYSNNGVASNWNKPTTYGIELGAKF